METEQPKYYPIREIPREKKYLMERETFFASEGGKKFIQGVHENSLVLEQSDIPEKSRAFINAIFPSENGTTTLRLSPIDIFGLFIVLQLIRLGLPEAKAIRIKHAVYKKYVGETGDELHHYLEYCLSVSISKKVTCYILAFGGDKVEVVEGGEYLWSTMNDVVDSHIEVRLTALLQNLLPNVDFRLFTKSEPDVQPIQPQVPRTKRIVLRYTEEDDSITVDFKDGKPDTIRRQQSIPDDETRLIDIVNRYPNQDITIKRRDGKAVGRKRIIVTKFQN